MPGAVEIGTSTAASVFPGASIAAACAGVSSRLAERRRWTSSYYRAVAVIDDIAGWQRLIASLAQWSRTIDGASAGMRVAEREAA